MTRAALYSLLLVLVTGTAMAYEPDVTILKNKGYSDETIRMVKMQQTREEYEPTNPIGPVRKFFQNILFSQPTEPMDEFGSAKIREVPRLSPPEDAWHY